MSFPLSVLDLSPIDAGFTSSQALQNTLNLAQTADQLGYTRYWLAEHHNSVGLASAAPEILIGHVANVTQRIRVGSGGIMLPNHPPLKVAETFRLLEALHPDRIDLGIGRAPGTDPVTAYALRRSNAAGADDFPQQLGELLAFATGQFPQGHPFQAIKAVPVDVQLPPIWLLGSSDYSAQLAAEIGVGFAFAHHINPAEAVQAMRLYRQNFTPSIYLQHPQTILTVAVACADSNEKAEELASSMDLMFIRLRSGNQAPLSSPAEALAYPYSTVERAQLHAYRSRLFLGDPATVRTNIENLAEQTEAEEIMITTMVYGYEQRRHTYELLAEAFALSPTELPTLG